MAPPLTFKPYIPKSQKSLKSDGKPLTILQQRASADQQLDTQLQLLMPDSFNQCGALFYFNILLNYALKEDRTGRRAETKSSSSRCFLINGFKAVSFLGIDPTFDASSTLPGGVSLGEQTPPSNTRLDGAEVTNSDELVFGLPGTEQVTLRLGAQNGPNYDDVDQTVQLGAQDSDGTKEPRAPRSSTACPDAVPVGATQRGSLVSNLAGL